MYFNLFLIVFAILCILLGKFLWKNGKRKEYFKEILKIVNDGPFIIYGGNVMRGLAVLLWFFGFVILILASVGLVHQFLFE